jgi:hypothetical protein
MIVVDQKKSMLPIEASVSRGVVCFGFICAFEVGDVPFAKGVDMTYDD